MIAATKPSLPWNSFRWGDFYETRRVTTAKIYPSEWSVLWRSSLWISGQGGFVRRHAWRHGDDEYLSDRQAKPANGFEITKQ